MAPPPPTIDITVNPFASFNPKTGTATVSGTATCAGEPVSAFVQVAPVTQQAGRFTVRGQGFSNIPVCDGTPRSWSAQVVSTTEGSRFAGGKATSETNAFACDLLTCGFDFEARTIVLRGQA